MRAHRTPVRGWRALLRSALRVVGLITAIAVLATLALAWWARPVLEDAVRTWTRTGQSALDATVGRLDYFAVGTVEVRGALLLSPADVVAALDLPEALSVWADLRIARLRLLEIPGVLDARIDRRLPGTLVLSIRESPAVGVLYTDPGTVITLHGHRLPTPPQRALDLPRIRLPADSAGADLAGSLAAAAALGASRLPWAQETDFLAIPGDGDLEVHLTDGTIVRLPAGPLPPSAALLDAVRAHARNTNPDTTLILDLRARDLITSRPR